MPNAVCVAVSLREGVLISKPENLELPLHMCKNAIISYSQAESLDVYNQSVGRDIGEIWLDLLNLPNPANEKMALDHRAVFGFSGKGVSGFLSWVYFFFLKKKEVETLNAR